MILTYSYVLKKTVVSNIKYIQSKTNTIYLPVFPILCTKIN